MKKAPSIFVSEKQLESLLSISKQSGGLILCFHGNDSGCLSLWNQLVAGLLQEAGLAPLLNDLLTVEEDKIYQNRFDIDRLVKRLSENVQWLSK